MLKIRLLNTVYFVLFLVFFRAVDVWGMDDRSLTASSPRRLSVGDIPDSTKLKKRRQRSTSSKPQIKRSASPVYDRAEVLPPHIYALRETQREVVELIFDHVESHIPHNDEGVTRWFLTGPYEAYCDKLLGILTRFNDSDERSYVLGLINEETDQIKKDYGKLSDCCDAVRDLSSLSLEEKPILLRLAKDWKAKHPFVPFDLRNSLKFLQSAPVLWMNFYDVLEAQFCGESYSRWQTSQAEKLLNEASIPFVIPVVQECMREWKDLDVDVPFHIRLIHLIHIFSKMHDSQREYKEKLFGILIHTQSRRERSYTWTEFYNCALNQTIQSANFKQVIDMTIAIQQLMPEVEMGGNCPNVRKFLYIMNQLQNQQGMMGIELYTALNETKECKRQRFLDAVYEYALDGSPESSKTPVSSRVQKLELFANLKKMKEDKERADLELVYADCEDAATKN
ncbi:MAG: hypothetical protein JSR85_03625 [Proteobacteria bacterium]|nr:hypothetical protein [Pseudomonadota bacterium]